MNGRNTNNDIRANPRSDKHGASRPVLTAVSTRDRISEDLRSRIAGGDFSPGDLLPSRRALAREYGVAIGTMQSAIGDLIADGVLVARDRMGTFVAEAVVRSIASPVPSVARPANFGLILQGSGWPSIIARVLEQEVSRQGGRTLFADTGRFGENAPLANAVRSLQAEGADGIAVIFPSSDDPFADIASAFDDQTPPCVFVVSQPVLSPHVSCVYYDSRDAGYQAAQHLLNQGCRELLFFAPYTAHWVLERCDGAKQALRHAGIREEALQEHIVPISHAQFQQQGEDFQEGGYLEAKQYLRRCRPPIGVIAANDGTALGFWQAAEDVGLKPGKDFALIGFDDNPNSRERGLSSLHPPLEALGMEAARLLLQRQRGMTETTRVCLRSCLIARASTHLQRGKEPHASTD